MLFATPALLALAVSAAADPVPVSTPGAVEPLRIAVLVDTSQAVTPHVNDLRMALRSFFRDMQNTSEIALFEFGDRPARLTDYTNDPTRLEQGVGRLFARTGSGAYALDALVEASRDLRARESGGKAVIVLISTEGPEFSQRYHEYVVDELEKTGAALHSFIFDRRRVTFLNDGMRERELTLEEGARATGGSRQHLLTSMALADRLRALAVDLKTP